MLPFKLWFSGIDPSWTLKTKDVLDSYNFCHHNITELTDKYISEVGSSKNCRIFLDVFKHVENYYECRLRAFDGQATTTKASNDAPASSSGGNKALFNVWDWRCLTCLKMCLKCCTKKCSFVSIPVELFRTHSSLVFGIICVTLWRLAYYERSNYFQRKS